MRLGIEARLFKVGKSLHKLNGAVVQLSEPQDTTPHGLTSEVAAS
jgi:hypothetical protein